MDIENCSAAVLAGGLSTRMGRDKAALPLGGTTLLAHQVRKLRSLGIRDIMVSGSALPADHARFVPDLFPRRGPLSGIHACLLAAEREHVLFLPVDVPRVPSEALRALILAHAGGATVLRHGGKTEPLIGVYAKPLAAEAEALLQTETTAVRRLLERTDALAVEFAGEAALLMNCNTPEAYEALRLAGIMPG
ncbi:MAG: molybdenum cofactor guanylyltransferase [Oscillospiraceae bacterium]|nr:molybdenum cofactor guanylyltransferase [Oscillospiraceae bacterium]